jgi:hypothetical protein
MSRSENLIITFRCPPELERTLPQPFPAVRGLPDWFKAMPPKTFSNLKQEEQLTVKKCPPFIDAMICGFFIPLVTDLHVENGVFTWDREVPRGALIGSLRSPVDFHENSQVTGTPFFEDDRFILKFNGFWIIELPPGYSVLITHPFNRDDLPFVTLTGLVDADRYRDNFINFPALWRNPEFTGLIPRGTPIAQVVPIKRDSWEARFDTIVGEAADRMHETQLKIATEQGVYRREFRASKS